MSFAHYKEIKLYYIFYIQRRKNMAKILKFICVIILFLSVSLVGADFDCKSFLSFFEFLLFTLYIIFYPILVTLFHYIFFITAYTDLHDNNPESYECEVDEDCPQNPFTMKCINNICIG